MRSFLLFKFLQLGMDIIQRSDNADQLLKTRYGQLLDIWRGTVELYEHNLLFLSRFTIAHRNRRTTVTDVFRSADRLRNMQMPKGQIIN